MFGGRSTKKKKESRHDRRVRETGIKDKLLGRWVYVCMQVGMQVCMYVCMYVCVMCMYV